MDVAGKRVAISGGSAGIGKALAIACAQQGAQVAILARDPARLAEAKRDIESASGGKGKVIAVAMDATDDASVQAAADQVLAAFGGVDVLIANQGYARCNPVWEASMDDFHAIMDTNFFGHVRLVRAFSPAMRKQGSGAICLVSSMLGFMSFYGYGAYSASKHAIVGFASALRQEMLPYGVQVNLHFPPTTDTPGLVEENKDKPELTWAIEGSSRKFTPAQVADSILGGIRKDRFVTCAGADSWFIYYASRFAPWLVKMFVDGDLRKWVKKHGVPPVAGPHTG